MRASLILVHRCRIVCLDVSASAIFSSPAVFKHEALMLEVLRCRQQQNVSDWVTESNKVQSTLPAWWHQMECSGSSAHTDENAPPATYRMHVRLHYKRTFSLQHSSSVAMSGTISQRTELTMHCCWCIKTCYSFNDKHCTIGMSTQLQFAILQVSGFIITGTPGHVLPARCLLLNNQTSCFAKEHFPVWLCNVLISGEWILLNTASFTHQQSTTQVTWAEFGNTLRQLWRQVQTLLATHLLQYLHYLSATYNHQCATDLLQRYYHLLT